MKIKPIVIDPRIQIVASLIMSVAVLFVKVDDLVWMFLFALGYLLIQGKLKKGLIFLGVFGFFFGFYHLLYFLGENFVMTFGFIIITLLRFIPLLMFGASIADVPSGKLMAALGKWKLPKALIITITVSLRFLRILKVEHNGIQTAAKVRGISLSSPKNWLHPMKIFEYTMVPLVMRSLKISDEIAMVSMTRGVYANGPKTSIYNIQMTLLDWVVITGVGSICVFLLTK